MNKYNLAFMYRASGFRSIPEMGSTFDSIQGFSLIQVFILVVGSVPLIYF